MSTQPKTLNDVKVGDYVIYEGRSGVEYDRLVCVKHVTKTQIHTIGCKFKKSDGRKTPASSWDFSRIKVGTPEEVKEVVDKTKCRMLIKEIKAIDFSKLSLHQLERIHDVINQ